jgi:hypothetical protein
MTLRQQTITCSVTEYWCDVESVLLRTRAGTMPDEQEPEQPRILAGAHAGAVQRTPMQPDHEEP